MTGSPFPGDLMSDTPIQDVSDTALWVAYYRAQETERPDALFRDPFARALAGERGEKIARAQTFADKNAWSFLARTVLFDRFIAAAVRGGADLVVNLAAGLDTRPYRMDLPHTLRWVEVDLPPILDYKEGILAGATPVCALERVRQDLSDEPGRRALFDRLGATSSRALVVTEGLILYLAPEQVVSFARDLHAVSAFRTWLTDLTSPGLLRIMSKQGGGMVEAAGAPFKFAPAEGPEFFPPLGWQPTRVESLLQTAGRLRRLPLLLKLISLLPESPKRNPNRPWSAVLEMVRS